VVIPCFNHGEFLPQAVASVIDAKRADVELIVVDDGSTDERTRVEMDALRSKGIRVIRQENKGLAAARNAGIAACTGEYILPLDADNRVRPEYFEHGIRILDANPKVGVVYGDAKYVGTQTGRWSVGAFDLQRLLEWNYIDACAIYRRTIWEQTGGYDGTMPVQGLEDWDFWLGAAEHEWEFSYVPEVLFIYRVAEGSMIMGTQGFGPAIIDFIARKHGNLYRLAWSELMRERESLVAERASLENERRSLKWTIRNLSGLLRSRIAHKLNGQSERVRR